MVNCSAASLVIVAELSRNFRFALRRAVLLASWQHQSVSLFLTAAV